MVNGVYNIPVGSQNWACLLQVVSTYTLQDELVLVVVDARNCVLVMRGPATALAGIRHRLKLAVAFVLSPGECRFNSQEMTLTWDLLNRPKLAFSLPESAHKTMPLQMPTLPDSVGEFESWMTQLRQAGLKRDGDLGESRPVPVGPVYGVITDAYPPREVSGDTVRRCKLVLGPSKFVYVSLKGSALRLLPEDCFDRPFAYFTSVLPMSKAANTVMPRGAFGVDFANYQRLRTVLAPGQQATSSTVAAEINTQTLNFEEAF